jgi:hypothetical protein
MATRIWLLEIEALDEYDQPKTLYFSSGSYVSQEGNYYDVRLKQPCLFTNSAFVGSLLQGSRSGYGEAVLLNTDSKLNYLADYSVDGRKLRLKLLDELGGITSVLSGTVQSLSFSGKTIQVKLRDPQEILNLADPEEVYLGNNILPNGLEGVVDDIKGKTKPKVFGRVNNAEPIQVNTAKLIYQFDSLNRPANLLSVYDRGLALTLDSVLQTEAQLLSYVPAAGKYAVYRGYFKLGAAPAGEITFDAVANEFLLGDVFSLIANRQSTFVNQQSITALNNAGSVGVYVTEKVNTSELLDKLATSSGAYWTFDEFDIISASLLDKPKPVEDIEIFNYSVISVDRSSTGAGSNGLPYYRVVFNADRIEKTQTDLAAAVPASRKARLQKSSREAISELTSVKNRHPLADELIIDSYLNNLNDAQNQANRIVSLFGERRDTVELEVRVDSLIASSLKIGSTVKVNTPYLGYDSGANFILLGYTLDARLYKATLQLWGYSSGFNNSRLITDESGGILKSNPDFDYLLTSTLDTVTIYDYLKSETDLLVDDGGIYIRIK